MNNQNIAILFLLCFASMSIEAQTLPALMTNGCGSGRFAFLVPNSTILSQCSFSESCNKHDICYGRCLDGGDLFGNATCNDLTEKVRRRDVCDVGLMNGIKAGNTGKPVCSMYAALYRWAVARFGESAFHGIEDQPNLSIIKLNKFLKYVEIHPKVFDAGAVEKAFELLNAEDVISNTNYEVIFRANPPQLRIKQGSIIVLEVHGVATPIQNEFREHK